MTDKDFSELLTLFLSERMALIYHENTEYNESINREHLLHEKLKENLNSEQMELLDDYFSAASNTTLLIEKLSYRQGLKDMFKFYKLLS